MHKHTNVVIDQDILSAIKPFLKRDGMTFSGFVRKAMLDYLEIKDRSNDLIRTIDSIEVNR
jgi:molybdopterin-guanine dinucleotide biosynthesis protein A